jgi:hypothetical protein
LLRLSAKPQPNDIVMQTIASTDPKAHTAANIREGFQEMIRYLREDVKKGR